MTGYFIRRFLLIIPTFIGITAAVFVVMHFVPGGPVERQIMRYKMAAMGEGGAGAGAVRGVEIPAEAIEEMKRYYGFDKPVHVR
jgi:microcin C transport system permease protein